MLILILVVSLVFASVGFLSNQPQETIFNPLYTYYFYLVKFMARNPVVFVAGFVIICIGFLIKNKGRQLTLAIVSTVQIWVLGILLSALVLFFVAFAELNILAVQFNINPNSLGVITDQNEIVQRLKKFTSPPLIITASKDNKVEVYAIATALSGKDNFYGNFVISNLPKPLVLNVKKPDSSILLIDNNLVVTEIDAEDMQRISPIIAYLFVSDNFTNRVIKSGAEVSIMSADDYKAHRKEIFLQKIEDIGEMVSDTKIKSESLRFNIGENTEKLEELKDLVKQIYEKQDKDFYKCLTNETQDVCDDLKKAGMEEAISANKEIEKLTQQVSSDEKLISEYENYVNFLESQKKAGEGLAANIPLERGSFDPPDKIRLTLGNTDAHAVADYFETLVHEYLHYTSYESEEVRFKDPFFEEGLTEYYARKAIESNLNISTNLGYPAAALIVGKMTKRLADSELSDIYFTKDQKGLEKLLDRVYGDNFYKNNIVFFNSLQYATNQKQILQLANLIMEKIGGEKMTEKDILSTFSNLN